MSFCYKRERNPSRQHLILIYMEAVKEIEDINKGLIEKGIKIRLEKRGSSLNFRGPLPISDEPKEIKDQRISLGLNANKEGISKAKKLLELLLLQLHHGQFNWKNWKSNKSRKEIKNQSLIKKIDDFKLVFFNQSQSILQSSKKSTWDYAYKPYLRRLQEISGSKELNSDMFCQTLKSYRESSRSRQQCASTLNVFAKYLNLDLPSNWKALGSGYGLKKYNFRELPNDELIKEISELIPNHKWKLVYGLMATYGLRNHEVFFSDYSSLLINGDHILRVLPTTKTGEHQVWPFHPEWVDFFGLSELAEDKNSLPNINIDLNETTLQQVGRRVSEQFKRYNLPIKPYDLRHAWAIRTVHIGLPDTVSARMMGHSVSIHNRTYHHWITRRDQQQAVDTALSRKNLITLNSPKTNKLLNIG